MSNISATNFDNDFNKKLVRRFADNLNKLCDANPHCPPLGEGRFTWLLEKLKNRFGVELSPQSVGRWLNGLNMPSVSRVWMLAQILNVYEGELMFGERSVAVNVDPQILSRRRRAASAPASTAPTGNKLLDIVSGFMRFEGATTRLPLEDDGGAKSKLINLYASFGQNNLNFNVVLGEKVEGGYEFEAPDVDSDVSILGVVIDGFTIRFLDITEDIVAKLAKRIGWVDKVTLSDEMIDALKIESLSEHFGGVQSL